MRLHLSNIGAVAQADVRLDGITVLAGENDTGKSTIGKALYAIVKSFSGLDEQIRLTRRDNVRSMVTFLLEGGLGFSDMLTQQQREFADSLLALRGESVDVDDLERRMRAFLDQEEAELPQSQRRGQADDRVAQTAEQLRRRLTIADARIAEQIVARVVRGEFGGQATNIYHPQCGLIDLSADQLHVAMRLDGDQRPQLQETQDGWNADITVIDDPHAVESAMLPGWFMRGVPGHRSDLQAKLYTDAPSGDAVEEIIIDERLEQVLRSLEAITQGEIVEQERNLGFRRRGAREVLDFRNVSDGKKAFAQLLRLLRNGSLSEGDFLVLDEPEIHLHPAWQLRFAELLVRLQREFGLTLLLSTHSPYFLNAIEAYSRRDGTDGITHYYLTQQRDGECRVRDVTGNLEMVYGLLAGPMDELERIERDLP